MRRQHWNKVPKQDINPKKLELAKRILREHLHAIELGQNRINIKYEQKIHAALSLACGVGIDAIEGFEDNLHNFKDLKVKNKIGDSVGQLILTGYSIYVDAIRQNISRKETVKSLEEYIGTLNGKIESLELEVGIKREQNRVNRNLKLQQMAQEFRELKSETDSDDEFFNDMNLDVNRIMEDAATNIVGFEAATELADYACDELRRRTKSNIEKTSKQMSLIHLNYLETACFKYENNTNQILDVVFYVMDNKDPTVPGQYSQWSAIRDLYQYLRYRFIHSAVLKWFENKEKKQLSINFFCLPLMNIPVLACHLGSLLLEEYHEEMKASRSCG